MGFSAPTGPVRANNFRARVYRPAQRATGLEWLTFRQLRQTGGDHMRAAGVPLEVIQKRMGHASIRTTADIYGSLPETIDRDAANKLDDLYTSSRGHSADIADSAPNAS
jgi:integrase